MVGTNKVVLNQMALGEKGRQSGRAGTCRWNEIAILKDSKDRHIGVPVMALIDDPQFDYEP